jgi:hypothetical protein
MDKII